MTTQGTSEAARAEAERRYPLFDNEVTDFSVARRAAFIAGAEWQSSEAAAKSDLCAHCGHDEEAHVGDDPNGQICTECHGAEWYDMMLHSFVEPSAEGREDTKQ